MKTLASAAAALVALVFGAAPVAAASFHGSYWDAQSFRSIDDVYAYTATTAATATFAATAIDYPNAGGSITDKTTLAAFLGADGQTLSGAGAHTLETSVFTFTGLIDLDGLQSIAVGSDDGFGLKLDGVEVMRQASPRAFAYTLGSHTFSGPTLFELTYYENYGNTGVEFLIGGQTVTTALAAEMSQPAPVPVPAALPLLLGALGALRAVRRR